MNKRETLYKIIKKRRGIRRMANFCGDNKGKATTRR
jgi:hypothetical protein